MATDLQGWTGVHGLYAVGEVARTGLHGANRLASNSLVEGLVMGRRSARSIARSLSGSLSDEDIVREALDPDSSTTPRTKDRAVTDEPGTTTTQDRIRSVMSAKVGIARDAAGLRSALRTLDALAPGQEEDDLMRLSASVIVASALAREESRGCHQRVDHPDPGSSWRHSVRWRLTEPPFAETLHSRDLSPRPSGAPVGAGDLR